MTYYAKHNSVGTANTIPEGAIEISKEQYLEALTKQASGERVTVISDEVVYYNPPIYRPDGTAAKEYTPGDPLITEAPPSSLHVPKWKDGKWKEGETARQKQAREDAEAEAERERLDAVTVNRAQGKAVLADQGYLSAVKDAVAQEPEDSLLRIGFEDSPTWKRGSAFINQMLAALELSEAEGDALFQAAQEIEL